MPWVRLDDNFFTHPKTVGLSTTEVTLHVRAICYSSQHLTDGIVPLAAIESWGIARWRKATESLIERGLWISTRVEHGSDTGPTRVPPAMSGPCIQIHDYLDYQRSADEVRKLSRKRASAGAKGGSKKAANAKQAASNLLPGALAQHSTTEPSSSPPTGTSVTEPNGAASGGEEETREQFIKRTLHDCYELMAEQTLDRIRAEGQTIHNPTAWKRATAANLATEHHEAALHHLGNRTTGTYYDLHVELAEQLDPRCGPADGGAHRAAMRRDETRARTLAASQGAA